VRYKGDMDRLIFTDFASGRRLPMTTEFAASGMPPSFSAPHGEVPRIEWVNQELKRVDYEMKALAYTAMFSVIGVATASALLYML
jgi:hypothetical protein